MCIVISTDLKSIKVCSHFSAHTLDLPEEHDLILQDSSIRLKKLPSIMSRNAFVMR